MPFEFFRVQWMNDRGCAEENFVSDLSGDFGVSLAALAGAIFFLTSLFIDSIHSISVQLKTVA